MDITLATEAHVPEIIEVWKEFMDFHKPIDPRFPLTSDAYLSMEKHLRDLMTSGGNLVLVAVENGVVIGYSIAVMAQRSPLWDIRTYGEISDMAVKADYRRRGIGEQMLAAILEWFRSRQVNMIELSVAARNQIGYSFWKKHGFKDYLHRLYLEKDKGSWR